MKKNIINFIATLFIALLLSPFLPWWSVMLAAFITAIVFSLKRAAVFVVPFFGIALYWMVYAYILSSPNDFILANKIAVLFPLQGNSILLIAVTGLIGGIAAGVGAVFGKQCLIIVKGQE